MAIWVQVRRILLQFSIPPAHAFHKSLHVRLVAKVNRLFDLTNLALVVALVQSHASSRGKVLDEHVSALQEFHQDGKIVPFLQIKTQAFFRSPGPRKMRVKSLDTRVIAVGCRMMPRWPVQD